MKQILKFPFAFFKIHFHRCFWLTRPTSSHFQECLYSVSGQVWNKPWSVCMSPITNGCSHRDRRKRPSESAAWARRPAQLSGVDVRAPHAGRGEAGAHAQTSALLWVPRRRGHGLLRSPNGPEWLLTLSAFQIAFSISS